jgi:hypothetical protein
MTKGLQKGAPCPIIILDVLHIAHNLLKGQSMEIANLP